MEKVAEPKFPKQHNPLYCFKIIENNDSVELTTYKIFEYEPSYINNRLYSYRFEGKFADTSSKIDVVTTNNLDRVVNKKFFTFNSNPNIAEKAFDSYFRGRLVDAAIRMNNAEQRYNLWRARNEQ